MICGRLLKLSENYSYSLGTKRPDDLETAADYAKGYIYSMFNEGVINGDNNMIYPLDSMNRAEAVVLISNVMKHTK